MGNYVLRPVVVSTGKQLLWLCTDVWFEFSLTLGMSAVLLDSV